VIPDEFRVLGIGLCALGSSLPLSLSLPCKRGEGRGGEAYLKLKLKRFTPLVTVYDRYYGP